MAAGCSSPPPPSPVASPIPAAPESSQPSSGAAPAAPAADSARPAPARVSAPDIGLDEPLIELGLTESGEMQVPTDYDDVGWFTGGGRPGAIGSPTVIAGHVDSTTGPAVFDRLSELGIGDVVAVDDEAGGRAEYRIDEIGDYGKVEFPTVQVFGAVPTDEIRLITCSGDFDASVGSYERNLVVYGVRQ
ncbi:class F sortase [Rhodococcus sp. SBT000017]|nr:class F sortase [Rhodococcus sp. SBT000017]